MNINRCVNLKFHNAGESPPPQKKDKACNIQNTAKVWFKIQNYIGSQKSHVP